MPVTAKLSRKFYETFGDEIANELVEWFNQVDATYRADLRELNELNFARFDAKLEQRVAEVRRDTDAGFSRLEQRVAELRGDIQAGLAGLKADLLKWMFTFWATTTLILLGTMVVLLKL